MSVSHEEYTHVPNTHGESMVKPTTLGTSEMRAAAVIKNFITFGAEGAW